MATKVGDRDRIQRLFDIRSAPTLVSIGDRPGSLGYEGLTAGWLLRGRRTIGGHRPDLVINNGALPFRTAGRSCNLAHDLGWSTPRRFDRLRRAYKRYAYGRCDHVVALCSEIRDGLARQLDVSAQAVRIIPPCVDLEASRTSSPGTREDAILHTGTEAYKDPAATIRAFAAVRSGSPRLYVEGEITQRLSRQVVALPAATRSRIELLGELSATALRSLLGKVRIASFPTRYAVPTASPTVVEAIAAGTPIAGSEQISADLLEHDGNGLRCRDDAELTATFERLLEDGPWASMSARALEMAPRFSSREVARTYLSLIEPGTV